MALMLELVDALKRLLKAQGLTYAALAAQIGVSEATVKRMFSRRAMSLVRLEQVCAALHVELSDLAEEARRGRPPLDQLSEEQEQALVADPALLLALYLVLNRWSQAEVLARYRFSEPEWVLLLARLDRLGIIELLPGNRTRSRTARNFRWRRDGPMQQFFQRQLLPKFFARSFDGPHDQLLLQSGMLAPESAQMLRRRLDELAAEFDRLMAQDAALPASARVGVSLVAATGSWSLGLFAELRRASPTVDSAASPTSHKPA
jgi:transcriptional regulator with XRE-family HTH domain